MSIKAGLTNIADIKAGSNQILKVMAGSEQIWPESGLSYRIWAIPNAPGSAIEYSSNAGASWAPIQNPESTLSADWIDVNDAGDQAIAGDSQTSVSPIRMVGLNNWDNIVGLADYQYSGGCISSGLGSFMYVSRGGSIADKYSENSGAGWSNSTPNITTYQSMISNSDGSLIAYSSNNNQIMGYSINKSSWINASDPIGATAVKGTICASSDLSYIYYGSISNGTVGRILNISSGGLPDGEILSKLSSVSVGCDGTGQHTFRKRSDGNLNISHDYGVSYIAIDPQVPFVDDSVYSQSSKLMSKDGVCWILPDLGGIWISIDSGATFRFQALSAPGFNYQAIAVAG